MLIFTPPLPRCMVCTLVKMLTFMDIPLLSTTSFNNTVYIMSPRSYCEVSATYSLKITCFHSFTDSILLFPMSSEAYQKFNKIFFSLTSFSSLLLSSASALSFSSLSCSSLSAFNLASSVMKRNIQHFIFISLVCSLPIVVCYISWLC